MKNVILHVFFTVTVTFSYSQRNVDFTAENFQDKKKELSLIKKKLAAGYQLYNKKIAANDKFMQPVIDILQPAYDFNPNNEELNFKMGNSYFILKKYDKALPFFDKAEKIDNEHDIRLILWLGVCEFYAMKYEESYDHLKKFINDGNGGEMLDSIADYYIQKTRNIKTILSNPINTKIEKINISIGNYDSISHPFLSSDENEIFFNVFIKDVKGAEKIVNYYSSAVESGWSKPLQVSIDNFSDQNYEMVCISGRKNKLILKSRSKDNDYDLYESNLMGTRWSNPVKMSSAINTFQNEINATFSNNDSMLYIVTNRNGGIGEYDIWKSIKDENGWWKIPLNIGNEINSDKNEWNISFSGNEEIAYITSDRNQSIGGADIFKSSFTEKVFSAPQQLGYPINTIKNEKNFFSLKTGNKGIMALQNDKDGKTAIYLILLPPQSKSPGTQKEEMLFYSFPSIQKSFIIPNDL